MSGSKSKVLFKMSGSIAAYKACEVISGLVKKGHEVRVAATESLFRFVGEATLEGLTGNAVYSDLYKSSEMMGHIHLDRWADLVVLCPASAQRLNQMACGTGHDLLNALFLAHDFQKPYLVFPAMNEKMLKHPSTQNSLHRLSEWGVKVYRTGEGNLACRELGEGRLLEPDMILEEIEKTLVQKVRASSKPEERETNPKRILVTYGGTEEKIDDVRSITNTSSGRTGYEITEVLRAKGHLVDALASLKAPLAFESAGGANQRFVDFADVDQKLQEKLSNNHYDFVIHLAAISDYSVQKVTQDGRELVGERKISSQSDLQIHLSKNFKILNRLKSYSKNKKVKVVGFKLTSSASHDEQIAAVNKVLGDKDVDYVVHNDLSEISEERHVYRVFSGDDVILHGDSRQEMALHLSQLVEEL